MSQPTHTPSLLAPSLLAALLVTAALPATAATFVVTSTADAGPGSLREAIVLANGAAGADVIEIQATGTIVLESPLPVLSESVGVFGPGSHLLVIDADAGQRHFRLGGPVGSVYQLQDLSLRNGHAESGGSVLVLANSSLDVQRCVFENNRSDSEGGAIAAYGPLQMSDTLVRGNEAPFGGGVFVRGAGHELKRSTFALNSAQFGGGIYLDNAGELEVENSTVVGNTATTGGGGIYVSGGLAAISHVTLVDNIADSGAGLARIGGNFTTMANNILADNTTAGGSPANCANVTGSSGGNLSSDASCLFNEPTDLVNTDPELDALADNGGPTPTMRPRPGSPAIDGGVFGFCASRDQRDLTRPESPGGDCDRGAVEIHASDHDVLFTDGFEGG
ncbi:MAG: right-handed parallel beta-helix repeat-containing protein [Xanthomonadales bacterium]|nr:right-handed parallel beta-helix repeat-containing protein [Xanthomonadales bacterium]